MEKVQPNEEDNAESGGWFVKAWKKVKTTIG
jgi:hypothetical protein